MNKESKFFEIERYGSEILRQPSSVITKFDRKLAKLADKMLKTMYQANGVGLAAPQIGINQRIIVIDIDYPNERYENEDSQDYNPIVMINPIIVHKEGSMESFEGCLSFPEVYFNVTRASKITFKYQDLNGKEHRGQASNDLLCRCIQHEIDHLDGKLFVDIAVDKAIARKELDEHGFAGIKSPARFVL